MPSATPGLGELTGRPDAAPVTLPDRTFDAVVFDWDGTAVPDRQADAGAARALVERLCEAGVHVVVVSGTHVGNVDGQLAARPTGPGTLHLCLNRGSEVFAVGATGPTLVWHRVATAEEDEALTRAAALTVDRLGASGVDAAVVSQRVNRRKVDIIPLPEWADPPKARIDELLVAVTDRLRTHGIPSLGDVVALAVDAARDAGVPQPRVTSDVKHVEIGLTDKSDSMRWVLRFLHDRGIGPGLVLLGGDEFGPLGGVTGSDALMLVPGGERAVAVSVGVEPEGVPEGVVHLGGGPERFLAILAEQLQRRTRRRTPDVDMDPQWTVALPDRPERRRVDESLGALGNGRVGVRGAREENGPGTAPLFVVAGVYADGDATRLLPGPRWTSLVVAPPSPTSTIRSVLDLRTGVLLRERRNGGRHPLRTLRFVSLARPEVLALRAEGPTAMVGPGAPLTPPGDSIEFEEGQADGARWARTRSQARGGIVVAARDLQAVDGGRRMIERLATWRASGTRLPGCDDVIRDLGRADRAGFDRLLGEHREAWARRWAEADVVIEGDPELQVAVRFALFHLMASVPDEGEAAVGARGLSGDAYGGHVFWDSDVFVLPMLAATHASAARAMLAYRIRRLDAARRAAAARGQRGARFPWESGPDGTDVTPRFVHGPDGSIVPIRTGQHEEHIDADVAWAAWQYAQWSGDEGFLRGEGRALLVDTARYWAGRARRDRRGDAHLYGVIGPDEYHEVVDDNAFTNVMARWNLERAADIVDRSGTELEKAEALTWRELARDLVDNYDPATGLYEQFAGYGKLEPLLMAAVQPPPVAADMVLGRKRVLGSQIIKQADVLMLHHLVPDTVARCSLRPNLAFYEPRTAHGSSLSPAIHAALLARAGEPDRALELLRMAARLDLDDLTGTSASGLHLATMGGVWQAIVWGFAGVRARDGMLTLDPHLPSTWTALEVRVRLRGALVHIRIEAGTATVRTEAPVVFELGDGSTRPVEPPGATFPLPGRQP